MPVPLELILPNSAPARTALRATLMLFAYRSVSIETHHSILRLITSNPMGWRWLTGNEAGVNVARSIQASRWWRDTDGDVFLMVDDDIIFDPEDAEGLVEHCRNGYDIIGGAYSVRDGSRLALRVGVDNRVMFGPGEPPFEVEYMGTGFLAVHRRVLDAMIPTLPLCHARSPNAFWPMFDFSVIEDEFSGGYAYLTEDYTFCNRARELGFKVWLDPSFGLGHLAQVTLTLHNMAAVHQTLTGN